MLPTVRKEERNMFGDLIGRLRMNSELFEKERGTYADGAEKKALRQAKKAEKAFRVSKGYEKKPFWQRMK